MGRPPSDIRARLIDAARRRFLERGVDGTALRDVAADAGTSLGIVVYWFPKKEDLFSAVLEEVYAPLVDELRVLLERQASTHDRLHAVALRIASSSAREVEVLRLVAREAIGSAARRKRILRRFLRGHVPFLFAALKQGVHDGELDASTPLPVMLVAFVALAALPQIARRAAGKTMGLALPSKEKLAEISLAAFFRAFAPRTKLR